MVKHFFRHKTIAARLLALTAVALLLTACNWLDLGGETATPTPPDIFAPANNTTVLLGAPVQIQSGRFGSDVSRVELWVRKPNAATDELLRSDIPEGGNLLQEWRPTEVGTHTITLRSYTGDNPSIQLARTYEVIPDAVVSLAPPAALPAPAQSSSQVQATAVPPTPLPVAPSGGGAEFQTTEGAAIVQVVATSAPQPTATPIPRYPPPPPIPGVPPGPLQSPLLNVSPPVCDAAEYRGPYLSDTSQRVVITEEDSIAAKVVGGTTVFRAWQLQNVGTCTWGPGYELAFYGGRSMGSGGVAFESPFPPDPPRRNTLLDANRLIVPEGKPNQVANVELALVAPVTPGIHQSYWRMRNPHGVFFGPIMGVTMEVVRDCAFGIYGAPVINKFQIIGVTEAGRIDIYNPTNPINVTARLGRTIWIDYNIINATNFDIVLKDPTGKTEAEHSEDQSNRYEFQAAVLGRYTVILYADNGPCTIPATIYVDVIPNEGNGFQLGISLASGAPVSPTDANASFSSAVLPGTIQAEWRHYDPQVNEISFNADLYKRQRVTQCLIEGWLCGETNGDWQLVQRASPGEISDEAAGAATICRASERCSRLPTEIIGAQAGAAQAEARISEAEHLSSIFCPADAGNDPNVEYGVSYYLEAGKDGQPADPARSNQVFVLCGQTSAASDFRPAVSETPSCTLTELGGITLPLACNDVPIAAGVMVVLLIVVLWVFFK